MEKFGIKNHITIPGFAIVELGLSGNELICFSLIYGFCQDGESEFYGSLSYIASATNMTVRNVQNVLRCLRNKKLINKRDEVIDNVKYCRYSINRDVVKNFPMGMEKISIGYGKNMPNGMEKFSNGYGKDFTGGMEKIANNNIIDNTKDNITDNIPADDPLEGRWQKFNKWINTNCPEVQKMKQPITREQFGSLIAKYSNDIIIARLQDMNNWAPLRKRNISAYQTLINWIQRDEHKNQHNTAGHRANATIGSDFHPTDI